MQYAYLYIGTAVSVNGNGNYRFYRPKYSINFPINNFKFIGKTVKIKNDRKQYDLASVRKKHLFYCTYSHFTNIY